MSLLDAVVAAITPEPSAEELAEVRAKARTASGGTGWLAQILDHHEQIDAAFAAVRNAASATAQRAAQNGVNP